MANEKMVENPEVLKEEVEDVKNMPTDEPFTVDPREPEGPVEEKLDPKVEREINTYVTGLSNLLHSKQSQPEIVDMLKNGGPPEQSVPHVVSLVNQKMADSISEKGKRPDLEVLLAGTIFLVGDLVEMGMASGAFEEPNEDMAVQLVKDSLQVQIQAGLKDGTIDPVELQQRVEPLMNQQSSEMGIQAGSQVGTPEAPNEMTAMESYGSKRQRKGMLQGGA